MKKTTSSPARIFLFHRRAAALLAPTFATIIALAGHSARAQTADPVLDLLVKHHVISDQEAQNARADIAKEDSSTPAAKLNISTPVKELKIYGDIRERFAINTAGATDDHAPGTVDPKTGGDHSQVNRFRLRLRLGLDVRLADNWLFGVRLETSNDGRSDNVTEGSVAQPFGKSSAPTATFVNSVTTGKAITSVGAPKVTTETVVTKVKTGTAVKSVNFATDTTTAGTFVTGVTTGKAVKTVVGGKTVSGTVLTAAKTGTAVSSVGYGYTVFVGQLYLRYKPAPWLSLEAGKIPNPLLTTPMVWDPDINPEGFAEQFTYHITPFGDPDDAAVKKGAAAARKSWKDDFSIDLFANLAQFEYSNNSPANSFGVAGGADGAPAADKNDTFLLAWQAGAKINFNKTTLFQIAPTYYDYTGHNTNFSVANFQGDGAMVIPSKGSEPALFVGFNQTGINNLSILDVPASFNWQVGKVQMSVFGDYAINTAAHERASKAGHPDQGDQNTAYQVGINLGTLQRKGDWNLKAYWQQSDQYALDPNLIDNNVFDGRLNMRGPVLSAAYNFTDAVTLAFTYNYGQRVDSSVGTGGPPNAFSLNPLHNYSFYFWDLIVKF